MERSSDGCVTGTVRTLLQGEALVVLMLSALLYWHSGGSWWLFFALLLVPDLSMLPYLVNPRAGAVTYNLAHTYVAPLALATAVVALNESRFLPYLHIWTAHIGMDRCLGYGLKYFSGFGITHLDILGKRTAPAEAYR